MLRVGEDRSDSSCPPDACHEHPTEYSPDNAARGVSVREGGAHHEVGAWPVARLDAGIDAGTVSGTDAGLDIRTEVGTDTDDTGCHS